MRFFKRLSLVCSNILFLFSTVTVEAFVPCSLPPTFATAAPTLSRPGVKIQLCSFPVIPEGAPPPISRPTFLGVGPSSPLREGTLLVSPSDEYDHFLMHSVLFVFEIGYDEVYDKTLVRAVIVDHPTAFTVGEMLDSAGGGGASLGGLTNNPLYRGGDNGGNAVILLHSVPGLDGSVSIDDNGKASLLHTGGISAAAIAVDDSTVDASRFKFFFNYVEIPIGEIQGMLDAPLGEGDDEAADGWMVLGDVPPEIVLDGSYGRGQAWRKLRKMFLEERKKLRPSDSTPSGWGGKGTNRGAGLPPRQAS